MDVHDNGSRGLLEEIVDHSKSRSHHFGPIYISGDARVQLGDKYESNRDIFETGTTEQRRTGRFNATGPPLKWKQALL